MRGLFWSIVLYCKVILWRNLCFEVFYEKTGNRTGYSAHLRIVDGYSGTYLRNANENTAFLKYRLED